MSDPSFDREGKQGAIGRRQPFAIACIRGDDSLSASIDAIQCVMRKNGEICGRDATDVTLDDMAAIGWRVADHVVATTVYLPLPGCSLIHVALIWVHPEHRRQGLGRAMLKDVSFLARGMGFEAVAISVPRINADGQAFLAAEYGAAYSIGYQARLGGKS